MRYRTPLILSLLMVLCIPAAWLWTPRTLMMPSPPTLASVVPTQFGDWRQLEISEQQISPYYLGDNGRPATYSPYTDILARTYVNSSGNRVQLMLAYANELSQEAKVHRPELCYVSQGFSIRSKHPAAFQISGMGGATVQGGRMVVQSENRVDQVSYWIRSGALFGDDPIETRWSILKAGVKGEIPDGILVRTSISMADAANATEATFRLQENFISSLIEAAPGAAKAMLLGKS